MSRMSFELPWLFWKLVADVLLLPFGFEVRGLQHLQKHPGAVILAGNHEGLLDSPMLVAGFRRYFKFLMTEEVFDWPFIGKVVRHGNILPLYKGKEKRAMVQAVQVLRDGLPICIFPEGKLTQDGELNPFNDGVAYLQEKTGAPILPFAIHGGFETWPQARRFPRWGKVVLIFGEPIMPGMYGDRAALTEALKEKVRRMKAKLAPNLQGRSLKAELQ